MVITPIILSGLLIFSLRIVDITLAILRMLMVIRSRKALAWLFGFCQATIFVVVIRTVLADMGNWHNYIGYAAGFATGNVVGILIEERLAIGYTYLRIISPNWGKKIAEHLRSSGFAVTEVSGRGMNGAVTLLNCSVRRKRARQAIALIQEIDQQAMVTREEIRPVQRGFWT